VNLLAIDPGSEQVAFAYFVDGRLQRTDLIRAAGARLERLHYIGEQLERGVRTRGWRPDVVAVEEIYVGRNAVTALRMANTVGYLERVIFELFPRTEWKRIHRAKICHALGLKGNAKGDEKRQAARAKYPGLGSQDEADAAAVGLAALVQ
jgi:Holliday junction resolvasome RuvABC endonuclease subunit